jgi:hypothetical protein
MAFNFQEVLSQPAAEIEKPKPLPVGHYICIIDGPFKPGETKDSKGFVEFKLKPLAPDADVDMEELSSQKGIGIRTLRYTLWLEDESRWRIVEFGEKLGLDAKSMTIGQILSEATGRQIKAKVKHTVSADGTQIYANVESVHAI